jgi:hypothetical protein
MTDEQAKATQEVAKTTGKFAEVAEKVGGFVSKLIGPASNQVGGILEDWTRYYRYKNLLAIADKVEAIHARRKLRGKTIPIPARVAIPMLESASLENDEVLQEIWAQLIANSTDPNFKEALHPGYAEIIKQMSPDEAIILISFLKMKAYPILFLNHVSKKYEDTTDVFGGWLTFKEDKSSYEGIYELYLKHCQDLFLKQSDRARVYIDNLQRLRIVELGHNFSGQETNDLRGFMWRTLVSDPNQKSVSVPARDEYLRMTAFGEAFVTACITEENRISNV